jgi:addiction module RelB/DinJ family antitoxin
MPVETTLFRARVPRKRLKKVEKILAELGLKPGDAFNMLLAQIELQDGLPFDIRNKKQSPIFSAEEQSAEWTKALGEY